MAIRTVEELKAEFASGKYASSQDYTDLIDTLSGGGGTSVSVSDTEPSVPEAGDLWWSSLNGNLYVYYVDEDSSQWIDVSGGGGGLAESDVQALIADLVDSAPATLDTLNELAAALGDDENFASTVTTALSNKSDTSHTHDDRYYTESETNTLLDSKTSTGKAIAMAIVFG